MSLQGACGFCQRLVSAPCRTHQEHLECRTQGVDWHDLAKRNYRLQSAGVENAELVYVDLVRDGQLIHGEGQTYDEAMNRARALIMASDWDLKDLTLVGLRLDSVGRDTSKEYGYSMTFVGRHVSENITVLNNSYAGCLQQVRNWLYESGKLRNTERPEVPDDIRAKGWAVAVHNDYRLRGENHTFWLFTKGERCVKGEGKTDAEALNAVRAAIDKQETPDEPATVETATNDA